MVRTSPKIRVAFVAFLFLFSLRSLAQQPTAPYNLTATTASCGQVNLSWSPSVDNSGTGLKAYTVWRNNDGVNTVTSIGAARAWFDDTMYVRSSDTMSYYVVAVDNAGNQSAASNTVTVATPACPQSAGEQILDSAYTGPLGETLATYGTVTAILYQKLNSSSQRETWINVSDSSTGQSTHFLLYPYASNLQVETGYVLTSATELWTISNTTSSGGQVLISQYRLNGTPPTSATLVSTKSLGVSTSVGRSLVRLASGALIAGWDDEPTSSSDLTTGFAYRSPTGVWAVKYPVTIPNSGLGGGITKSRLTIAQHPADGSIWSFVKRDSYHSIAALHFTELSNDMSVDWITPGYIQDAGCSDQTQSCYNDGDNGPEPEFPFVTAAPDPTRNAILLAYQSYKYQIVFIDPLYGSMSNNMFMKQALATVAQIGADGSKTFIPSQSYIERVSQFGMSVDSSGVIWLAYQPIKSQTLTWNEVYASKYENGTWSSPSLVGLDYQNYNTGNGLNENPSIVYRTDKPQVTFRTPDLKIHAFDLSNLGSAPADTTSPTTSITSPTSGSTVSTVVTVTASATDNVGVTRVELLVDGTVAGTSSTSPASFAWDTEAVANGNHNLQTRAYDAAGNVGLSSVVSANVSNAAALSDLKVAITSPGNGAKVPRSQKVNIDAAVTDSVAVKQVQFLVNKKQVCSITAAPYSCVWKVPAKPGIVYNIQAAASDVTGTTASVTITVTAQ